MPEGLEVNKSDLSEILGFSERTLTQWQSLGMPIVSQGERGCANRYHVPAVVAWMLTRAGGGSEQEAARERLDRLRGDREELTIGRELDQLAPPELYQKHWNKFVDFAEKSLREMCDGLITEAISQGIELSPSMIAPRLESVVRTLRDSGEPEPSIPNGIDNEVDLEGQFDEGG